MEEEISIPRDQVEVLGEYSTMPNKDCTLRVHPFVGFIKKPIEDIESIIFNADEVYKVFTVPMQDLIDPEKRSMVRFRNSQFLYPVWKIEEEDITIWGLTAFILDGKTRKQKVSRTRVNMKQLEVLIRGGGVSSCCLISRCSAKDRQRRSRRSKPDPRRSQCRKVHPT
jgi:hypothetical protein